MTTEYEHQAPVYTRVGQPGVHYAPAEALRTQQTFTRDQVAWLMAQAMRWGYEHRVDEENAVWPDTELIFSAGDTIKAIEREQTRRAFDAASRLPSPGDYRGGPVRWDEPDQRLRAVA